MNYLFFYLLFFILSKLSGYQIDQALIHEGDFIVYAFKQELVLLIIQQKTESSVTVEELSLPKDGPINWQEWVANKAPGHTSWTCTKIDLGTKKVLSLFDVDAQRELTQAAIAPFLPTLLKLTLEPLKPEERKYIGPQPQPGEIDLRKPWLPKILFNGKELHPEIAAFRAYWPKDNSELSGKPFDLYFAANEVIRYLPYWIEMYGPVSKIKIMAIDSGTNLSTKSCR
jgi:hypothetical protein